LIYGIKLTFDLILKTKFNLAFKLTLNLKTVADAQLSASIRTDMFQLPGQADRAVLMRVDVAEAWVFCDVHEHRGCNAVGGD
jgi:hypothetical protein